VYFTTDNRGLLKSFRYWLYQCCLSLLAVLAALALLETGFRVARHGTVTMDRLEWRDGRRESTPNQIYEKSDEFEFTATLNQDGFRGPALFWLRCRRAFRPDQRHGAKEECFGDSKPERLTTAH
jgi:hypothetical protein